MLACWLKCFWAGVSAIRLEALFQHNLRIAATARLSASR
jgi:hypothetical protein